MNETCSENEFESDDNYNIIDRNIKRLASSLAINL